jgi:glyoxylase-like metal-dependent hydrolase (beta-lactamase superfamily II)
VLAFSPNIDGVDGLLNDGDTVRMGDETFEVIHMPGHSSDSICLYNEEQGALFAGDSPLLITSPTGTYETGFLQALDKLCARDVRSIYPGHGTPLTERCNERLRESRRMAAGDLSAIGRRERIGDLAPVTA